MCRQYPINERVSATLQPAFRKREIMTTWSRDVAYSDKDGADSDFY